MGQAYVSGILVDYLIPTVYLTDILIILLLAISWFKPKLKNPLSLFLLLLLPSLLAASFFLPAAYKWIKLVELAALALWIKTNINWQKQLPQISFYLSLAVLWQSLLALAQWFKQSSLFGYWFLGEQPYSTATAGMDKITWWDGSLRLPPLGTTPHPNVLAGLIICLLPLLFRQLKRTSGWKRAYYTLVVILGLITIFLTFSLAAWLALMLIVLPFTLRLAFQLKPVVLAGYLILVISLIIGFWPSFSFLAPQSSFDRRSQLTNMALSMTKDSPLIGQGLNNFTVKMENYGYIAATTRFLQPVHNIYLLVLAETGILGLAGFIYLIACALRSKNRPAVLKLSLFTLLFLGLFDHYPFTIQQGLLLLFLLV